MSADRQFENFREAIRRAVPPDFDITAIEFEAAVIVIYTKTFDKFSENSQMIKDMVSNLKKRIEIRPDPSILEETDEVEEKIRKLTPEEAEITGMFFDYDTGVVIVEAKNPGAIFGKDGQRLNDLKKDSGWNVKPVRSPPIPSVTINNVRGYNRYCREEYSAFLKKVARNIIYRDTFGDEQYVRITALGGFRQVGRSCSMLMTKDSKVLIDCGIDPSSEATPYLNTPEAKDLSSIDAVVITHAHMDHCGLLPALFRYGYDGPVYCTAPTRDLMALMQLDAFKLMHGEAKTVNYGADEIRKEMLHIIPLGYEQTTDITPDIKLTLYNAGHILGSSIAHFNIGNGFHNVAFSGDTKYEKTWLFNQANYKFKRLETLVIESTYGGHTDMQPSRMDASREISDLLKQATETGGKVMIPVFAVGRSQEVMLVIEELMRTGRIPILPVYLDGMIWEATAIHTAYPEFLNSQLKTQIFQNNENPFLSPIFKRVESPGMREDICNATEPCIVLATSGMMTGGPIMEYFKAWAEDEKNWLIFVGYQSENSMGRLIQKGKKDFTIQEKGLSISIDVQMHVETVDGFSGHSDRKQLMSYIAKLEPKPSKIIVGHGEDRKCIDFASSLYQKYKVETKAPMNLETIRLR